MILLLREECGGGEDGGGGGPAPFQRLIQRAHYEEREEGGIGPVEGREAGAAVDESAPLIFIGGHPRSGTTLMRAMLDAHPAVRCGEETRIIPRILGLRANWKRNKKEAARLTEAGIDDFVINSAVKAFLLQVPPPSSPPHSASL